MCTGEKHGLIRPKHGWVRYKKQEVEYHTGRYELRTWEDGRRVYKALETCDPVEAWQALNRARKAAINFGAHNPMFHIRTSIDLYLRDLNQRRKPEMAEKAQHVLGEFRDFCADPEKLGKLLATTHVRSITREHILRFHAHLRKKNSARTVADKHQRVKAWLKFCKVDTGFMPPVPKYERKKVSVYTPAEIKKIRTAADDHMLMVIDLALKLGLREREIMHAEWPDVDSHHATFRVQSKVRKEWRFMPKDAEQRVIPIPSDLLHSLTAWRKSRPQTGLIVGNDDDKPEGHLLRKLKALARNAGLNCGRCEGCQRKGAKQECERWFLHRFRATYLTKIARSMDLKSAQTYAGHADIATTQIYLEAAEAASPETQAAINAIQWE